MQTSGRVLEKQHTFHCVHVGMEVEINSAIVYPVGLQRGIHPRIVDRKCDRFSDCHLQDKQACPMSILKIKGRL